MVKTELKTVEIDDLRFDYGNYRFAGKQISSDEEAASALINDNVNEFCGLLKSIKQEGGLFKSELLAVFKSEIENGKYIVGEGNSRLLAIKLSLGEINLSSLSIENKDKSKIQKLLIDFPEFKRDLLVVVYESKDDMRYYLMTIHSDGDGHRRKHKANAKAMYSVNSNTPTLLFIEKYLSKEFDTNSIKNLSTITRVFNNKSFKNQFNIENPSKKDLLYITSIISDIVNGTISVSDVYKAKQIVEFIEKKKAETDKEFHNSDEENKDIEVDKIDHVAKSSTQETNDITEPSSEENKHKIDTLDGLGEKRRQTLKNKNSNDCIYYFDKDFLSTNCPRKIKKIIDELSSLDALTYPYATYCLFRTLLELVGKDYANNSTDINFRCGELEGSLRGICTDMWKKHIIDNDSHSHIINTLKDEKLIKILNEAVHNLMENYDVVSVVKSCKTLTNFIEYMILNGLSKKNDGHI